MFFISVTPGRLSSKHFPVSRNSFRIWSDICPSLTEIKGMHARIRKKALIFLLRHGGMRGRELRNDCEARVKKKYLRDCDGIIDLAICCCTYASFIADWQLLNSFHLHAFPCQYTNSLSSIVYSLPVWFGTWFSSYLRDIAIMVE